MGEGNKKNQISKTSLPSPLTDLRDAGEEDPYPDDEGRLDAGELDADDVVLWLRRVLVMRGGRLAAGGGGGDVVAGGTRGQLRVLRLTDVVIAARRGQAVQGGVVGQSRADRAHGSEAHPGVGAVRVAGKVADVVLRPMRGVLLGRDPPHPLVKRREAGATACRQAQGDDDDEQR